MSDDEQPTDLGARIEAIAGSYLEVARKRKGKDVMSTLDEAYDNFMRQVGVDYNTNVVQAEIKDPNTKADYLSLLDGILREYAQRDGTTKPRADKFNGWADSLVDRFNAEVAQYLTNVVEVEDDEVDDDQVTSPSGDGVTSAAPLNFDLPDDSDQAYSQPDVAVGTVPPPPDVPPSPLETELDPKTPEGAGIPDPSATDMFGIPDVASDTYDDAIEDTPAFSQNTTDFFQQGTQATDDDPIVGGRPISTFPKPNVSLGSDEPVIEDFEVDQTYVKAKKHRRRLGCGIATFVAGAVATAGILIGVYKSFNVGDFVSSYLSGSNGSNNTVQEEQAESADRLAEAADTGSPEATAPEPVVIPITITAPEQVVIPTITAPEPVSPPQPDYTEITLDSGYVVRYAQTPSGTIEAVDQTDLTVTYEVSSGLVGQTLRLRYDTNDDGKADTALDHTIGTKLGSFEGIEGTLVYAGVGKRIDVNGQSGFKYGASIGTGSNGITYNSANVTEETAEDTPAQQTTATEPTSQKSIEINYYPTTQPKDAQGNPDTTQPWFGMVKVEQNGTSVNYEVTEALKNASGEARVRVDTNPPVAVNIATKYYSITTRSGTLNNLPAGEILDIGFGTSKMEGGKRVEFTYKASVKF